MEITIDGTTYVCTPKQVEAPAFAVGDWVEAVEDDRRGSHCFSKGAQGIVVEFWKGTEPGVDVDWKTGSFSTESPYYRQAYLYEVKRIAPPAPLKYAPGQVVMVPMVVVSATPGFDGDEFPYLIQPLGHPDSDVYYISVPAIEPPAPQPGDVCWFWDSDGDVPKRGKLARIDEDDEELPYRVEWSDKAEDYDWFRHCVKCHEGREE